jgi:hypothetical protein
MAVYNINITFSTDGEPTDLELGDITLAMSDILNSPQVESPAGGWIPADFEINEFVVDLYEETGERVWRHSLNPDGLLFTLHENNLPEWCSPIKPATSSDAGLPPAQAWLYRLFRRWNK